MNEQYTAYYLRNFWGYGNWNSPFWFMGLEEGGGHNLGLVNAKINVFHNRGYTHRNLIDNRTFQVSDVGPEHANEANVFLGPRPNGRRVKLQNDWRPKMKILLGLLNMPNDNESLRSFQQDHWGRVMAEGENLKHAVIELMPLPSPGLNRWDYGTWSADFTGTYCPVLDTRRSYTQFLIEDRIQMIRQKWKEHKPRLILFFARDINMRRAFEELTMGANIEKIMLNNVCIEIANTEGSLLVRAPHPGARGLNNDFWNHFIEILKDKL